MNSRQADEGLSRISFGPGVKWLARSTKGAEREAKDPRLPLAVRIRAAAVARAGRVGHAQFRPGELQELVGAPSPSALSKGIARAKELELIHLDSRARCLVLAHWEWQSGHRKGPVDCLIHDKRFPSRGNVVAPTGQQENANVQVRAPDG